jgi:diacylglycerol O-acyltransferase / wax synthase
MVRLSGMEAVALHSETTRTPAHTIALIVMEASETLSHERLRRLVASTLPPLARFRSRLVAKPFGLGQPVWAEADNFNPSRQMRRVAVPSPGGPTEFADLVAKLTTRPLDRHMPLWQAWSIEGLAGGRWALALKMSLAVTGGLGGVGAVTQRLLTAGPDDQPGGSLPTEPSLGTAPTFAELIADTAVELAGNQLNGARWLGSALPGVVRAAVARPSLPRTVFNEPLTERREVAFAAIPLTEVNAVKDGFGVDADDVLLGACTLSLRGWLQRHGGVPEHPLVIDTPAPGGDAFGHIRLPVHLDDAAEVVSVLASQTVAPTPGFATAAQLVAPSIVHAGMRLYTGLGLSRRLPPGSHGLVARIPSLPGPVYCAGAEVVALHAVPPLIEGAGLAIAVISHADVMDVSVCVCPDHVDAVGEIADGIVDAIGELRAGRTRRNR